MILMQFLVFSCNFPFDSDSCISGQRLTAHPPSPLISLTFLLEPLEQCRLLRCTMYAFGAQCKTALVLTFLSSVWAAAVAPNKIFPLCLSSSLPFHASCCMDWIKAHLNISSQSFADIIRTGASFPDIPEDNWPPRNVFSRFRAFPSPQWLHRHHLHTFPPLNAPLSRVNIHIVLNTHPWELGSNTKPSHSCSLVSIRAKHLLSSIYFLRTFIWAFPLVLQKL